MKLHLAHSRLGRRFQTRGSKLLKLAALIATLVEPPRVVRLKEGFAKKPSKVSVAFLLSLQALFSSGL